MTTATLAAEKAVVKPTASKPGILVVDDEDAVRQLLQISLQLHGFRVWTAADGVAAQQIFQTERAGIAAVLLDVRMPGLDGPATLRALEEIDPEVRVAFMSGNLGNYTEADLLALGARAVIAKPFDLGRLAGVLRDLVVG